MARWILIWLIVVFATVLLVFWMFDPTVGDPCKFPYIMGEVCLPGIITPPA